MTDEAGELTTVNPHQYQPINPADLVGCDVIFDGSYFYVSRGVNGLALLMKNMLRVGIWAKGNHVGNSLDTAMQGSVVAYDIAGNLYVRFSESAPNYSLVAAPGQYIIAYQ